MSSAVRCLCTSREALRTDSRSSLQGEIPVLPLSVYGALAAAGGPQTNESSGSGIFLFRYSKANAGLGGLSFSEGDYSVFGYVEGEDKGLLGSLQTGDTIRRARIVAGAENLYLPQSKL